MHSALWERCLRGQAGRGLGSAFAGCPPKQSKREAENRACLSGSVQRKQKLPLSPPVQDVLAGRKTAGTITGEMRIKGFPWEQRTFARVTG